MIIRQPRYVKSEVMEVMLENLEIIQEMVEHVLWNDSLGSRRSGRLGI